jgi:putative spermidine/putrescine transport system permease protein
MTEPNPRDVLTPADEVPLKTKLRRAERMRKVTAAGLTAPLFLALVVSFIVPIAVLLYRSIDNPELLEVMPRTAAAMAAWDGDGLPAEAAFVALAHDLREARTARTLGIAAKRLNYDITGFRSLILKTARKLPKDEPESYRGALISIDQLWGERPYWAAVQRASPSPTPFYLLAAVRTRSEVQNGSRTRIIRRLLMRTGRFASR